MTNTGCFDNLPALIIRGFRMRTIALLVAVLLSVATVTAAELQPFKVSDVMAQQQQIRSEVQARKGRYADMPSNKRDEIIRTQDRLFLLLQDKETSSDLNADQHMRAFAALETIEALVNNQDDERLVCTREKTLGSNRVTRVCRTKAQMEAEREFARQQMLKGVDQMRR